MFLARGLRPTPAARDLPAAALSGLLGFAAYNAALAYGQTTVSAGTAGLLHASIPVFTALLAVAFLKERLEGLAWAGIAVSFMWRSGARSPLPEATFQRPCVGSSPGSNRGGVHLPYRIKCARSRWKRRRGGLDPAV